MRMKVRRDVDEPVLAGRVRRLPELYVKCSLCVPFIKCKHHK